MERFDSSDSAAKTQQNDICQILAILHKWGIHMIGQLAALDKQQLGARLGPEAIRLWERANGQSSRVIKLIRPPESFEESFEFESEQFGLFETTLRNPHQLSETLARLTALLGADRVGTPVLEETHRPDAFQIEPFAWALTSVTRNLGRSSSVPGSYPEACRSSPLHILRSALRRFRPAISGSVVLDEDRPSHVRGADIRGKIVDQRGPYLFSGNWWDEKLWALADWDLQLETGELVRCHESEIKYGPR